MTKHDYCVHLFTEGGHSLPDAIRRIESEGTIGEFCSKFNLEHWFTMMLHTESESWLTSLPYNPFNCEEVPDDEEKLKQFIMDNMFYAKVFFRTDVEVWKKNAMYGGFVALRDRWLSTDKRIQSLQLSMI